jgi:hypothetical protein
LAFSGIIQEISKARKLEVLCGNERITWDQFSSTLNELGPLVPPEVRSLQQFRVAESTKIGSVKRFGLLEAMNETRTSVSSDVRDKIYALLGLTPNGVELVPTPNYIRPVQSVYFQTLKAIISKSSEFAYIMDGENKSTSSTQEPNWTDLEIGVPYWIILILKGPKDHPISLPPYDRSKERSVLHSLVLSKHCLHLSGCILDSINSIASSFPGQTENIHFKYRVRKFGPRPVHHDFSPGQALKLPQSLPHPTLILRDIWHALVAKNKWYRFESPWTQNGISRKSSHSTFELLDRLVDFDDLRLSFALTALCQGDKRDFYMKSRSYFRSWFQENSNRVYYGQTF